MKNSRENLRYGDIIMINYFRDSKTKIAEHLISNITKILKKKQSVYSFMFNGYLSSYGFLNDELYFEKIEKNKIDLNYRNYLFVVCPKLNSEFHDEYKKSKKHLIKLTKINYEQQHHISSLKMKTEKLKEGLKKEIDLNKRIIRNYMGKEITYGSEIQLKHYISNMFLSAKNSFDDIQSLGVVCVLNEYINKNMIFKFLSKNNNSKIGRKVRYNDTLTIFNVKFKSYLSFNYQEGKSFKKYKEYILQNSKRVPIMPLNLNVENYRMHFGEKKKFAWKILLFRSIEAESTKKGLKFFSLVTFRHTETEGYLHADICYKNNNNKDNKNKQEVFVRKYNGEHITEKISTGSIWEIQSPLYNGNLITCSEKKNGFIITNNLVLKHFLTNKYLEINENKECLLNDNSENDLNEFRYLNFQSVVKSENLVTNNRSYYIKTVTGNYLKIDLKKPLVLENKNLHDKKKEKIDFDIYGDIYDRLKEKEFEEERHEILTKKNISVEDPYLIRELNKDEKYEIYFVTSGIFFLYKLILKMRRKKKIPNKLTYKYKKVISGLINFLYGIEKKQNYYYFEEPKTDLEKLVPIPHRQKIMKDSGLIDLIIEIIYINFSKDFLYKDENYFEKEFFEKLYNLLRISMMEYRPNELYASQWLNFIREQALKRSEEIGLNRALTELIDNNEKILSTRITPEMIKSFVEQLKKKDIRYITLLKALLISDGRAMVKNQIILNTFLFDDLETRSILLYKLRKNPKSNAIEIKNKELYNWISLRDSDYKQVDLDPESIKHIEFFVDVLDILYDMCAEKNFKAIDELKEIFKSNYLICIITQDGYNFKLKKIMCKILNILWINTYSYHKILIPNPIKIWKDFDTDKINFSDFIINNKKSENYTLLMNYITKILYHSVIEDLSYLNSILELIKTMIEFGFCNDIEMITNMIKFIKKLIITALFENKPSFFKNNDKKFLKCSFSGIIDMHWDNEDLVKCVENCLSILEIIIDYDFEFRVIKFFFNLKKLIKNDIKNIPKKTVKDLSIDSDQNYLCLNLNEKQNFGEEELINNFLQNEKIFMKEIEIFFQSEIKEPEIDFIYNSEIILCLIHLIQNGPNSIIGKTFSILVNYFNKGSRQKNYMKKVQLIFDEKNFKIYEKILIIRNYIFESLNNYDKVFFSENKNILDSFVLKITELLNFFDRREKNFDILNLKRNLKDLKNLENFEKIDENSEILILLDYRSFTINNFLQELNRNLNLLDFYVIVLKYNLIQKTEKSKEFKKLVKIIYNLLFLICKKNSKNKLFISKLGIKDIIIPLLKEKENRILKLLLFKEIFQDNKILLKMENDNSEKIIDTFFEILIKNKENYLYGVIILRTLEQFINYKEKTTILKNQKYIIKKFFSNNELLENQNFIHSIKKNFLKFFLEENNEIKIEKKNYNDINFYLLDFKVYFFFEIINLLILTSKNNIDFSYNLVKNFLTLEEIYNILNILKEKKQEEYIIFKSVILDYFNKFYFLEEREGTSKNSRIFIKIINILVEEIKEIILKQNFVSEKNYFIFENFILFDVILEKYINQICYSLVFIIKMKCFENFKIKYANFFNEELVIKIKENYIGEDVSIFLKMIIDLNPNIDFKFGIFTKKIKNPRIKKRFDYKINTILEFNEKKHYNNIGIRVLKKNYKNEEFINYSKKELENLIEFSKKGINFDKFLKNLLKILLENGYQNKKNIINILKIIRFYLEKVDDLQNVQIEKIQVRNFTKASFNLYKRQKELLNIQIIPFLCKLISQYYNEKEIISETLKICIGLLIGGNMTTSNYFYNYLINDEKNIVLRRFSDLLTIHFNFIKEKSIRDNEIILEGNKNKVKNISVLIGEKEAFEFHMITCCRILRFFQLLCEGHNKKFQNYLREQDLNNSNFEINFIKKISTMLGDLIKFINPDCLELGVLIFEFFIEAIQGPCKKNQKLLHKSKVVEYCKDLIEDYHMNIFWGENNWNITEKENLSNLIKKSMKFLNTILEGNNDIEFKKYIADIFKWKFLINHLKTEFLMYYEKKFDIKQNLIMNFTYDELIALEKGSVFSEKLCEVFYIFFFIKIVNLNTDAFELKIGGLKKIEKFTYDFFNHNSSFVEIYFKNRIEVVYFIKHPACNYLSENDKLEILEKVDRNTRFNKIYDFTGRFNSIFDKMEHFSSFSKKKISLIANKKVFQLIRILNLLLVFIININYFFYDEKIIKDNKSISVFDIKTSETLEKTIITNSLILIEIIYLVLSIFSLIIWCLIYFPIIKMQNWNILFQEYKRKLLKFKKLTLNEEQILSLIRKNITQISEEEHKSILRYFFNPKEPLKISTNFLNIVHNIKFYLQNKKFYTLFVYCIFAYLGLNFFMIFFTFNLLIDLYLYFENISIIYKSLRMNPSQILFTLLLMNIIIFNFAMFGFNLISDNFFFEQILPNGENMCTSALQCFLTVFSLGARSSGCIGDILTKPSYSFKNRKLFYIRYIYDVSIFMIVNLLFINILFVIIIDNFSELREKEKKRKLEDKNVCFICSLEKTFFDTISHDFDEHVKKDHNIWDYVFFIYSVKTKDFTEYNGFESFVKKKIDQEDINWFPFYRTKVLGMNDGDREIGEVFRDINERLDGITKIIETNHNIK